MTTRREQALLLCIARRELDNVRMDKLRQLIRGPIDWNYLLSMARQQGMLPLLHKHLSAVETSMPAGEFERVKDEVRENAQSVLYLVSQLRIVLNRLREEHVSVLAFKGPLLAQLAYGDLSMRAAGDLDLLIPQHQFKRVRPILESLGLQMSPPLNAAQQMAHLGFHCEMQFMSADRFTVVDLHWSLSPKVFPFGLKTEELMSRAQDLAVGGVKMKTFGLEDLVLFLSMHGAKHYWPRLEWISALAEIIRSHPSIDWRILVHRARLAGGRRILGLGLRLAERVGNVETPPDVLVDIDKDEAMKKVAGERLVEIFKPDRAEYQSIRAVRENLKIMDRKKDAFTSFARAVFVPTLSDWQTLSLPKSLHPLYYVVRPFRLTLSYAVGAWQMLMARTRVQTNAPSRIP